MPVMEYLERNAKLYGEEIALVELNPAVADDKCRQTADKKSPPKMGENLS